MQRRRRGLVLLSTLALVAGLVAVTVPAAAAAGAAAPPPGPGKVKPGTSPTLSTRLNQLADPAVRSLSSADQAKAVSLAPTGPGSIERTPAGDVVVEVTVSDTSAATIAALKAAGASVFHVSSNMPIVSATVPIAALRTLGAVPQVRHVEQVLAPMRNATCPTGIVSEGVGQMRVDTARTSFPTIDGSGVKVGVLSDTYNKWAAAPTNAAGDVTGGELPGTTNPCGYTTPVSVLAEGGSGYDEGRAMLQIVHDVAPASTLAFATALGGESLFADNIRALRTSGAKVIVDDYTYFAEPMYQDGLIGKAVEDVSAAGVTYFSSAANSNGIVGGNDVASNEAPAYRPTICPTTVVAFEGAPAGLSCHDFDPGAGTDNTDTISLNGSGTFILGWNEPQYGVATDLDFFLLNHATGAVVASSADTNPIKPFEIFNGGGNGTYDLVVARYAGTSTPRLKWISLRAPITANEYPVSSGGDVVGPTTFGHNVSRSGASVAAVPYNNAAKPEDFSSRGPALYCWGPVVGTTPAAPLPACQGATIDVAATDGTLNSFFIGSAPYRFYGTSAAAPHAAGVAALILQKRPCLTPDRVIALMKQTGQPVGSYGVDAVGGGLVDANTALAAAASGPCGGPALTLSLPAPPASGWYPAAVSGTVTATDPDKVASLSCTGATVSGLTGIGTASASATVTISALGTTNVQCDARDTWGDAATPGTATVRIGVAPTASLKAPTAAVSLTTSTVVRWAAAVPVTVPPTTITSYQLQRAVKAPGGALGAYANYGGPRTTTSVTVPMTAGYGYCFRVQAAASNGPPSAWSAPRCTTRATDDRALIASRNGWVRGVSRTAYLRTVTTSTKVGAVLVVPKSRGTRLALVVSKLPGGGTIGVYVKGRKVASVSTSARRVAAKVIVTLRVATAGTPVVLRVDAPGTRGVTVDGFAALP